MDFEVLSTPPRPAKPKESDTKEAACTETAQKSKDDRQKACSRLLERLEEPSSSSNRTLTNGVCTDSRTLDQDSTSVEVLEEGDQSLLTDSTVTTVPAVNGEVSSPAARKDLLCLDAKEQNSPALADVAPTANAEESRGFNYNSDDFRQVSNNGILSVLYALLRCCRRSQRQVFLFFRRLLTSWSKISIPPFFLIHRPLP